MGYEQDWKNFLDEDMNMLEKVCGINMKVEFKYRLLREEMESGEIRYTVEEQQLPNLVCWRVNSTFTKLVHALSKLAYLRAWCSEVTMDGVKKQEVLDPK